MADPALRATFKRPFTDQLAAFRLRLGDLVPTSAWDDISRAQHDRAFMVAGATKADLLADLAQAVDKSIRDGGDLKAFRADFRDIVERRGWHGWTGEGTAKGEAWRTKVILQTNMLTSMAAGRHAQLVAGNYRYWIYRHSGAAHPRLDHLAWDGLILPADHPFWATHYPPNGWGCGCKVRGARTMAGAIRAGGKPQVKLPADWARRDPKTGAPPGVGKGWDYAPGASVADVINALTDKTVAWPYVLAKEFMTSLPASTADDFATSLRQLPSLGTELRRFSERALGTRNGAPISPQVHVEPYKTLGRLTSAQERQFGDLIGKPVNGFDFTVSPDAVRHVFAKHGLAAQERPRGQRAITPDDFGILAGLIDAPDAVFAQGDTIELRKRLLGETYIVVFERLPGRRMMLLKTMFVRVGTSP